MSTSIPSSSIIIKKNQKSQAPKPQKVDNLPDGYLEVFLKSLLIHNPSQDSLYASIVVMGKTLKKSNKLPPSWHPPKDSSSYHQLYNIVEIQNEFAKIENITRSELTIVIQAELIELTKQAIISWSFPSHLDESLEECVNHVLYSNPYAFKDDNQTSLEMFLSSTFGISPENLVYFAHTIRFRYLQRSDHSTVQVAAPPNPKVMKKKWQKSHTTRAILGAYKVEGNRSSNPIKPVFFTPKSWIGISPKTSSYKSYHFIRPNGIGDDAIRDSHLVTKTVFPSYSESLNTFFTSETPSFPLSFTLSVMFEPLFRKITLTLPSGSQIEEIVEQTILKLLESGETPNTNPQQYSVYLPSKDPSNYHDDFVLYPSASLWSMVQGKKLHRNFESEKISTLLYVTSKHRISVELFFPDETKPHKIMLDPDSEIKNLLLSIVARFKLELKQFEFKLPNSSVTLNPKLSLSHYKVDNNSQLFLVASDASAPQKFKTRQKRAFSAAPLKSTSRILGGSKILKKLGNDFSISGYEKNPQASFQHTEIIPSNDPELNFHKRIEISEDFDCHLVVIQVWGRPKLGKDKFLGQIEFDVLKKLEQGIIFDGESFASRRTAPLQGQTILFTENITSRTPADSINNQDSITFFIGYSSKTGRKRTLKLNNNDIVQRCLNPVKLPPEIKSIILRNQKNRKKSSFKESPKAVVPQSTIKDIFIVSSCLLFESSPTGKFVQIYKGPFQLKLYSFLDEKNPPCLVFTFGNEHKIPFMEREQEIVCYLHSHLEIDNGNSRENDNINHDSDSDFNDPPDDQLIISIHIPDRPKFILVLNGLESARQKTFFLLAVNFCSFIPSEESAFEFCRPIIHKYYIATSEYCAIKKGDVFQILLHGSYGMDKVVLLSGDISYIPHNLMTPIDEEDIDIEAIMDRDETLPSQNSTNSLSISDSNTLGIESSTQTTIT